MKIFQIDGYEVIGNTDSTEGRGRPYTIAYATRLDVAEYIAEGKGVMGSKATVTRTDKVIKVYESITEYEESLEMNKVKIALSKLSADEIKLLGIEHLEKIK